MGDPPKLTTEMIDSTTGEIVVTAEDNDRFFYVWVLYFNELFEKMPRVEHLMTHPEAVLNFGHIPTKPKEEQFEGVTNNRNVFVKQGEQIMPCINGKPFVCECGCKIFTVTSPVKCRCNACQNEYQGESK